MNRCCTVFTECRMQILKKEVMGAKTWWGGMFQPPRYLASEQETQHMFDTLVQCSSKKTPKHYCPRKKVKELFGLGFLCRTRMDYTQPQPGSVSGVAILPQWAESPNQTGA